MWRRLTTLRWRLTLFYAALVAALLLCLGFFVYTQLDGYLTDSLTREVQAQGRALQKLLNTNTPGKGPGGKGGPDSSPETAQRASDQAAQVVTPTLYMAVLDPQGHIVVPKQEATNPPPFRPPLPTASDLATVSSEGVTTIVALAVADTAGDTLPLEALPAFTPGERGVRVVVPLPTNGEGPSGYLVLAESLHTADALLAQLRLLLLLGIFVALALAVGLGLPIVGLGLRPLVRMTATARTIAAHVGDGERDLGQRVALPGKYAPSDEIGQLGFAFNAMLDGIDAAFRARRESEERTRRFAADASHELRSPLTTLGGSVDVLLRGAARADPATIDRLLRTMRREVDRMTRLVVDLLTLTRFDSAAPDGALLLTRLRLDALAADVVAERQILPDADRTITFTSTGGAAWVQGDGDRLRQVLANLLDNAIRHTAIGGHITVDLAPGPTTHTLTVADDGEGIAATHLPHIFDRFYRVDPARARATGSAGLGLAIVKAAITAHHGQISVASTPGAGTTFSITLPAAPPV